MMLMLLICLSNVLLGQVDSVKLIEPTGSNPVGTITYEWTDESRDIQLTSHEGDKRTIIVQLWYPAKIDSHSIEAPYSSLSVDYQNTATNTYLRPSFSEKVENSNLIIFSPGRGTERFLYTTLAEELASHGFVVAAIDMPQIGYVYYQDGFLVRPVSKFRPPPGMMGGPYEKVDEHFKEPTALGNADLSFAYKKIVEINKNDPNNRFTGKINVKSLGIFGHSLGGRIAGRFAAENKNVKAYISMEGIPPRDVRYEGKLDIPVAMLCSSGTWPYAKENYFSLIDNRTSPVFMIELIDFGHVSVSDNPYIYPDNFNYKIEPKLGLELSRDIVLKYFNYIFYGSNEFRTSFHKSSQVKFEEYK